MAKESAITIRIPSALREQLAQRALTERRSLSAQAAAYLERGLLHDASDLRPPGRILGLFEGAVTPSDKDFAEVRAAVSGSLRKRRRRRA